MNTCLRTLSLVGCLLLLTFAPGLAQQAKDKDRTKAVVDLASQSASGKEVAKKAASLKKLFPEVRTAMQLYNARKDGGIGFGDQGKRGIERTLVDLEEDGISKEMLSKLAPDLTRAAHLNLVLMEITRGFAPDKPFLGRGKKEWDRDVQLVLEGSRQLLKAVKAQDPKAVQAAAVQINKGCNNCHDGTR